ncbi:MAG: glycosyltransferase family A protein [Formivibrio sp.]|nr:glycosyltransferase family A protein [Formivibrio sp.]
MDRISFPLLLTQVEENSRMENQANRSVPLISVIVPAHNAGKFLAAAIDSIFAQDYRPIEVILVDDGSTDNTAAIAQSYPDVRYAYGEKQGSAVARNTALTLSSGEFIAFLDADDLWSPNKLTVQAKYLIEHPEVNCVNGKVGNFLEPQMACPAWVDSETLSHSTHAVQLGAILVRRSLFDTVGLFNPSYLQGEDLEWFFRIKEPHIPIISMEETVVLRRIHASNISHNQSTQAQMRLRMMKESLDRKRKLAQSATRGETQ